jgi:RNA polymerase sigma-70 factor (ECF subfamily)
VRDVKDMGGALAELVVRSGAGDQVAFGRLYDATAPIVYGMALSAAGDPATAEALTAEVYLAAWQSASGFDAESASAGAWLADIAFARIREVESHGRRPRYATKRSPRLAWADV